MDAERQEKKDHCEKKREEREDTLMAAHETMYKYTEAMSEQFGSDHSTEYYYRLIMQQPKLKIKPKKISKWNVFVHKGMQELNKGTSIQYRPQIDI